MKSHPDQLIAEAIACFSRREIDHAQALCEEAVEADPGHLHALSNLAAILMVKGDLSRAAARFEEALAIQPHHAHAVLGLAKVRLQERRFDDALAVLAALNGRVPAQDRPEWLKLQGVAHAGREAWDDAVEALSAYRAARPGDADPLQALHATYSAAGREEDALATLEALAADHPVDAAVLVRLVAGLTRRNAFERLHAVLEHVTARPQADAALFNVAAHACLEMRRYAYAFLYYRRAAARHPDFDRGRCTALAAMERLA